MKPDSDPAEKSEVIWHLYMIRLENGHLYTGITTDIERRFAQHQAGNGAKYLRGKKKLQLVFNRAIGNRSTALKMEATVKKFSKAQKEKLIVEKHIEQPSTD